ncbi:MAG: WS/DGAT domain-containing protein, partial [Chromatocurvus sp.]
ITFLLGLSARLPAFSTVVSNVPGPREKLYWNGASLDGMYPASIVFDGFAMNITLVSYHDNLDFGVVACRRSLPQIQRIIDHLEESLQELEEVAGLTQPAARTTRNAGAAGRVTGAQRKAASPAKAKAKPKPKTKPKPKPRPKPKPKAKRKATPKAKSTS